MPLDMEVHDMIRDVRGCVVMYKGKPVYVSTIHDSGNVEFLYLHNQQMAVAPFTLASFRSPNMRLGFINVGNSVVYSSRTPIRKFYYGYSRYNVEYSQPPVNFPAGKRETLEAAMKLHGTDFHKTLIGEYPSLLEAEKLAKESGGACAFDRQFAISNTGGVYYKVRKVGQCIAGSIVWNNGCEHLNILLDNNHEKTLRNISTGSY